MCIQYNINTEENSYVYLLSLAKLKKNTSRAFDREFLFQFFERLSRRRT